MSGLRTIVQTKCSTEWLSTCSTCEWSWVWIQAKVIFKKVFTFYACLVNTCNKHVGYVVHHHHQHCRRCHRHNHHHHHHHHHTVTSFASNVFFLGAIHSVSKIKIQYITILEIILRSDKWSWDIFCIARRFQPRKYKVTEKNWDFTGWLV